MWPRTFGKWFAKTKDDDPDAEVLKSINGTDIKKGGKIFNPGFSQLKTMAEKAGIPLLVCLHPDITELEEGRYNEQGQEIISWCKENGIALILELEEGLKSDMFRDGIHTNVKGQYFEAELMKKYITKRK